MYLRPSEIFYSQDSINNVFDKRCKHAYKPIGETLDAICEGRCSMNNIPTISVVQTDGKWVTADNRRLWVYRQLERLGKCEKIHVQKGYYIPAGKLTSYNGGESVRVRGSTGGYWHLQPSATKYPKNIKNANLPIDFDYSERNAFIKPASNTSSNRILPEFNNQFSRASSSHYGGYGSYDTSYGNSMNTNNATTSMFPKTSSTVREPPVAYKSGTTSNLNQGGLDRYGRNSGHRLNESNMFGGVTSNTGLSSVSQSSKGRSSPASSSSSSRRENVNQSKTRNNNQARETRASNENDGYTSRYVPEQRVYRHKTYDRSYNGNERPIEKVTSYSDTGRDNGCCIII
ncbi:uncharacterized protein LOC123557207 [Mercenaria mercenaria]|uniref:uncharacterized protein LOC123557207 n=1 Tax=Mercenaria mercenaria TaxID=6596 RepID=UPI00234EEFE8|nr:uncharacterized protein LOC123557207 [Mercenaria mercenaria]